MAANRFKGIRASLVWNYEEARTSRNDDDANVLCLSARELQTLDNAKGLINVWLKTPFDGSARFRRRIKQMDQLT